MTGEMDQSEVTQEAYPLHFAIAKATGGDVRAFDQYQGPYINTKAGKLWIIEDDGGPSYRVYNERTNQKSIDCFHLCNENHECAQVADAAVELMHVIPDYEAREKRREIRMALARASDACGQALQLVNKVLADMDDV